MKTMISLLAGTLLVVLAIPLIGLGAALPMPGPIAVLVASHPRISLFLTQLLDVALPMAVLSVMIGAALGRTIRSRAARHAGLAALPYLGHVAWAEWQGPAMLSGPLWFGPALVVLAVVIGLLIGVCRFGGSNDPRRSTSIPSHVIAR